MLLVKRFRMISVNSYDLNQINAANIDLLLKEGWKLKEEKVLFEGNKAYQIYERSIFQKHKHVYLNHSLSDKIQGVRVALQKNQPFKLEELKVAYQQNHLLNNLNKDILTLIVKGLASQDIFHLSIVDNNLKIFFQNYIKDLNEIQSALIQADNYFKTLKLKNYVNLEQKLMFDKLDARMNILFKVYNISKPTKKNEIGNFLTSLKINVMPPFCIQETFSEDDELRNLHVYMHQNVKLFLSLSKLSKSSITHYLENLEIKDTVFKFKIKCFIDNFQLNLDEIKCLFEKYLESDDKFQITEIINFLTIINCNAAHEYLKKRVDYLLNSDDPFMLIDKKLISFLIDDSANIEEDATKDMTNRDKYNLKNISEDIYKPIYVKEAVNNFTKLEPKVEMLLNPNAEFKKCHKNYQDYMITRTILSLFREMIASKPYTKLNLIKEKLNYVGLSSDFFLFNMVQSVNDFPTAMRIINLIDNQNYKFEALDLSLHDYSILKLI